MAQTDNVLQPEGDVTATEGEAVTLGCQYNSSSSNEYLYWYKQDGNNSPKFILSQKLSTRHDKQSNEFHLEISSAALTDSAVYYCALRPTVTGNTTTLYKTSGEKTTQYSTTSTRGSHTLINFYAQNTFMLSDKKQDLKTINDNRRWKINILIN
uniref:Ig-like domain-containing protein n=1 Tax=Labrus bergylta TaxID=56723 RepID=A0A3Q3GDT7_9LABR